MSKGLLDPKVDFVFKNIFGSEKNPEILISFLNATLKPKSKITAVKIKGTDIAKQFIEDKYSRLDVKATTSNNETINIEIQLKNEHNMIKRSMYYLSKMYEEQLGEGDDYSKLGRTVCINILNFKYLKTERFHTGYRLKEIETNEELTDIIEMHFIEIPKLEENSNEKDRHNENDILVAWTEFLKDPESEKVRSLEMTVDEIRRAKDQLIRMSNDTEQREIYEMRAKILKDKVSALNKAKEEGREEGREEGIILARREDILENLSEIGKVSEEITKMVSEEKNIEVLKKWLRISMSLDSLQDFIEKANLSRVQDI